MLKFTDFLNLQEMAMAMTGSLKTRPDLKDLDIEQHLDTDIETTDGQPKGKFTASGRTYFLYDSTKRGAEAGFLIASDEGVVIGYIILQLEKICNMSVWKIYVIHLVDSYQKFGIGTELYKFLANIRPVMSDDTQYLESRKLWAKLSRLNGYVVHAVNPKTCKIVDKAIQIKQTNSRDEYDERYFSLDKSKKDIVFLFKKQ